MIDIRYEELIPLGAAAKYVPGRKGRKVAGSTLWRWAVYGSRGVRLEALRTPGGWCTSVPALQRFLAALAEADRAGKARTLERVSRPAGEPVREQWVVERLKKLGMA